MLRRLALWLTLATAAVTAVTVIVPAGSEAAGTEHTVNAVNTRFGDTPDQNPLPIEMGDSVVWHIGDGETHTITPDSGNPADFAGTGPAGLTGPADFGPVTFDTPGTYSYHCEIHPQMKGTIVVAEPPTTTTTEPPTTTTTTEPPTTTTTKPPTTTTTTRPGTTTTTAPHTTTTTVPPATTSTTQPGSTVSAAPGPTTTTRPTTTTGAPAPTTTGAPGTTTTRPNKDKGNDPTTTTGKHKQDETAAADAPAPPGDDGFAAGIFKAAEIAGAKAKPQVDANGAPLPISEHAPRGHGTLMLVLTGIALVLFGLGLVGYKWWTRESRYLPA